MATGIALHLLSIAPTYHPFTNLQAWPQEVDHSHCT